MPSTALVRFRLRRIEPLISALSPEPRAASSHRAPFSQTSPYKSSSQGSRRCGTNSQESSLLRRDFSLGRVLCSLQSSCSAAPVLP